jgi:hypothetical protein
VKKTNNQRSGAAIVYVRIDQKVVAAKVPRVVNVQFEFHLGDAVPVDNLVNNLWESNTSFVDAIDAQRSLHAIRRLFRSCSQTGPVDGQCDSPN